MMMKCAVSFLWLTSTLVSAQQTNLNGVPHAPDERLLAEYWEGFYLAKPSGNPRQLTQRAPTKEEAPVVESAARMFAATPAKAMALVNGGDVVWSNYKTPATPSTRLTGYSLGKTMTSMAVGKALCDQKIAMDTKAGALVPEVQGTAYAEATVESLLSMSSGIKDGSYYRLGTTEVRAKRRQIEDERTAGWREMLKIVNKPRTSLFGPPYKPGDAFEYKESDPLLLGLMVEAATGQSFAEYIEHHVLWAAGTSDSVALRRDKFGTTYAPTVARMTLEDWVRFAVWIKDSETQPGCFGDYAKTAAKTKLPNRDDVGRSFGGYGYYFWTENIWMRDSYWASGFGGQRIGFNPKNKRILVVFSSLEGQNVEEYYKLYRDWAALP